MASRQQLISPSGKYWLIKSEPEAFNIDDLILAPKKTTHWDGVRNYQARNTLRDQMQVGDLVLFHHSNSNPPAVVGIARVVRSGYPDHTAFDPKQPHYDAKSRKDDPTWFMVDVQFVLKFAKPQSLSMLKQVPALKEMVLLQRGSRLSVQPVRPKEFLAIIEAAS